jgi:hypothetical protein
MNATETAVYQALERVTTFGATHAAAFPATSNAATGFARVGPLLAEIGPVTQQVGAPASPATDAKAAIFDELWDDLRAIAKTARRIDRQEPGTATTFRLGQPTQLEITATATAFLKNLQDPATVAKFIAYDLPEPFVADLVADLKAIADLGGAQDEDFIGASGTTARIRGLIKEGRELLKTLDTSVTNRFRRDPEVLAEWKTAARIHRGPRSARPEPVTDPTPTPAPPPATPPQS